MLQAFARFTNAPINIVHSNNPFKSITGYLPVVSYNKQPLLNRENLIDCLDKQVNYYFLFMYIPKIVLIFFFFFIYNFKNLTPDFGLTDLQLAEEHAAISMIDAHLEPALLFVWYFK